MRIVATTNYYFHDFKEFQSWILNRMVWATPEDIRECISLSALDSETPAPSLGKLLRDKLESQKAVEADRDANIRDRDSKVWYKITNGFSSHQICVWKNAVEDLYAKNQNKVHAIKGLRELTGWGLLESKVFVDRTISDRRL